MINLRVVSGEYAQSYIKWRKWCQQKPNSLAYWLVTSNKYMFTKQSWKLQTNIAISLVEEQDSQFF